MVKHSSNSVQAAMVQMVAGQSVGDLIESLKFYKESEFKTHSTTLVMSKQVKNMNMQDLNEVATYVSKLSK